MVGALVTVLFVGVLQLALTLHVRTTLIDCAAEGARFGALAGSTPAAGAQRARDLEVRVRAPLPVLGLLGPGGVIAVSGRAVAESW
jgi:hypothetical protein